VYGLGLGKGRGAPVVSTLYPPLVSIKLVNDLDTLYLCIYDQASRSVGCKAINWPGRVCRLHEQATRLHYGRPTAANSSHSVSETDAATCTKLITKQKRR
jgi:hypothetical protein